MSTTPTELRVRGILHAVLACTFLTLGVLWWGAEGYLKSSTMVAVAVGLAVFSLNDLLWSDTRRPAWANAALGAVLAYFLVTVTVLLAR